MYAPGIPENVVVLTAPQLFGILFNWALYGVLAAQVYYYHTHFKQDKRHLALLVYGLFILETVQSALLCHDAYEVFGIGWGDPSVLTNPELEWFDTPLMDGILGSTVQCFFAYRIYVLSKSKILTAVIVLLSLTSGIAGITEGGVVGTSAAFHNDDSNIQAQTYKIAVVWFISSAVCDLLISGCMIGWYWKTQRSSGGFRRSTEDILTRILRIYVASGCLTASVAVINAAIFIAYRNEANNEYIAPGMVLGKLYSNSMLALLNQRYRVDNGTTTTYLSAMFPAHFPVDPEAFRSADPVRRHNVKATRSIAFDTNPQSSAHTDVFAMNSFAIPSTKDDGDTHFTDSHHSEPIEKPAKIFSD